MSKSRRFLFIIWIFTKISHLKFHIPNNLWYYWSIFTRFQIFCVILIENLKIKNLKIWNQKNWKSKNQNSRNLKSKKNWKSKNQEIWNKKKIENSTIKKSWIKISEIENSENIVNWNFMQYVNIINIGSYYIDNPIVQFKKKQFTGEAGKLFFLLF